MLLKITPMPAPITNFSRLNSALGTILVGYLGETIGWAYGFGIAGLWQSGTFDPKLRRPRGIGR